MEIKTNFILTEIDLGWNGIIGDGAFFDIRLHDDAQPEDQPTEVASLTLNTDDATKLVMFLTAALEEERHARESAR